MQFDLLPNLVAISSFVLVGMGLASMILFVRKKLISSAPCKIQINGEVKEASGGNTLLNILLKLGIPVPSPCGGKATCKQCRVRVAEGGGEVLEPDRSTFTRKELLDGWRLSCQCKVKNDIRVLVPPELLEVQAFEGTVISNENVATFIKELVVEIPMELHYKSGAYLQFHTTPFKTDTNDWKNTMDPKFQESWEKFGLFNQTIESQEPVVRAYSMASFPQEGLKLRFNIRIATPPKADIPWGICSSFAFSLKPGDKLKLSGPYGESFMKNDERELIFLIGGAGSSFGRSHILHLFRTEKTKRKVTLWYGARSLKENIYENDYRHLERDFENFKYRLVLSEPLPEDHWPTKEQDPVKTNYLFKAFEIGQLKGMETPEDCLYYVCGPPMHNKSVMKLLDDYGVPRENIVLDDFGN